MLNEDTLETATPGENPLPWKPALRGFALLPDGELPPGDKAEMEIGVEELRSEMRVMNPNMSAIEEYQSKMGEYRQRVQSLDDATHQADEAKKDYDEFRRQRWTMSSKFWSFNLSFNLRFNLA